MIDILKANPIDASLLAGIAKKSFLESHGNSATAEDLEIYVSNKLKVEIVKDELKNPENIYYLLYFNKVLAGYSKIILNSPFKDILPQNITKLDRLYLLKEFYARRIGLNLFEFNLQISKNAKQQGMWLYTWIENERAIQFYKKAGFVIVANADFKISETHSNPNYIMYLDYAI